MMIKAIWAHQKKCQILLREYEGCLISLSFRKIYCQSLPGHEVFEVSSPLTLYVINV